jgi:hypothetical protein
MKKKKILYSFSRLGGLGLSRNCGDALVVINPTRMKNLGIQPFPPKILA